MEAVAKVFTAAVSDVPLTPLMAASAATPSFSAEDMMVVTVEVVVTRLVFLSSLVLPKKKNSKITQKQKNVARPSH